MQRILYSCPYVPAEWIAAHGCEPYHVRPQGQSSVHLQGLEGVCAFVGAFLSEVLEDKQADAVIVTTLCDQMRRAFDLYTSLDSRPAFLFNLPSTWQTANARRLYSDEVKRLGRFLTRLGGHSPDPAALARIMCSYDDERARLRAQNQSTPAPEGQTRLALVGGPLLLRDDTLLDILRQCGASIVLDATETGLLGTCRAFDRQALQDPFTELVNAYFDSIQHVGRRPNTGFYQRLHEDIQRHGIQGIIWRRYLWCDLWHAALAHARESLELPIMDLEVTDTLPRDHARLLNRVQAFVEMLK
jgi:benzoyl-CoA reductase/2-hydroxyglutaryl-CoA dehydratase subunit BcrC/BadD/HgdB